MKGTAHAARRHLGDHRRGSPQDRFTKGAGGRGRGPPAADDHLAVWVERYLELAVRGVRSAEVTSKIARHLDRFGTWFAAGFGHDRRSAVTYLTMAEG